MDSGVLTASEREVPEHEWRSITDIAALRSSSARQLAEVLWPNNQL
jgi:hypothetical protein